MYRPNKPQGPDPNALRNTRIKLDPLTVNPTKEDLENLLSGADINRGVLCELQIHLPDKPVYLLTCQYETKAGDPTWGLYEGEDGSKVLWSCPTSNMEILYDMVCMSFPAKSTEPLNKILPPKDPAPAAATPQGQPQQPPQQQWAPQQPPQQQWAPQQPPQQQWAPQQPPQQQWAPQQPPQQQWAPQQPPQQQWPPQQQPPPQPQQPPPQQWGQQPPPQQWGQQPPPQQWGTTQQWPAQQPPYPMPGQPGPGPGPGAEPPGTDNMGRFADLLSKGAGKVLLGHLFVESGMIPEPCLEAALKVQELVNQGVLSNEDAIIALKKAAENGGRLDESLFKSATPKTTGAQPMPGIVPGPAPSPGSAPPPQPAAGDIAQAAALDPRELARMCVHMLMDAGIIAPNDLETAQGVVAKHGGEVASILCAAGKLEKNTLEAAKRCVPLVRGRQISREDAFKVVQHCQNNKVTAEEAFQTLGMRSV